MSVVSSSLTKSRRLPNSPSDRTLLRPLGPPQSTPQPRVSDDAHIRPVFKNPLLSLLETCRGRKRTLDHLKQIQAQMVLTGLILDGFSSSRLVLSSAALDLSYSKRVLLQLQDPNVFTWNVVIRGYSSSNHPEVSLALYRRMPCTPDNHTFPFLFRACSRLRDVGLGRQVLAHAMRLGSDHDLFVLNAAISFFSFCGEFGDARRLFDSGSVRDLVSWNSLINGYARCGRPEEGLKVFRAMKDAGLSPDEVTMIGVVSCCTQLGDLQLGREIHHYIEENSGDRIKFTPTLANALMDMYVKCGCLEPARMLFAGMVNKTEVSWTTMIVGYLRFGMLDAARTIFDEMPEKNIFPWNAMITGYVKCKQEKEAFSLFREMQHSSVDPDEITVVSLLSACSQVGAVDVGLWLHRYIDRRKLALNVQLGTALVDMYAKCGNIEKSLHVFEQMSERNAMTYTAVICGLASHGLGQDAISFFDKMVEVGLQPDDVTFIGVLSACSHAGLVDDGRRFFSQMRSKYNLDPKSKHYSCMVDLLGRAGFLSEAEGLVKSMPMKPDAVVLGALFFACRVHGNIPMGERMASLLLKLDAQDSGIYVLLANIYEESNMQDKAGKVRMLMRERLVEKTPGCSSIEVNGIVHEFTVKNKSHPQSKNIWTCLKQLARQMEIGQ